ncbi:MAG TPA: FtsH protease activity modulator HflK [Thermoanaerobaculia bacterium]|nr:FtsH protease activity modulator HflK [Thermoanaerobaculia bacterium]
MPKAPGFGRPNLVDFPDLSGFRGGSFRSLGLIAAAVAALVLLLSSYYQIAPYEKGVILRFGRFVGTADSGPNFKIPFVDTVYKVPVERQLKAEFGFRTLRASQKSSYDKEGFQDESLMLTGDLNIADVEWVVQYRIHDPYRYLFAIRDADGSVRQVAEAEMRGVVGDMGFNEVIKTRRHDIEGEVRQRMQEILDSYDAGIDVKLVQLQDVHPPNPVKDSFEEVNRALQEMERAINEALQERNRIIFRVEGEAKQRIAQAEGYKVERVNRSQGDAERFRLLLAEYRKAPQVTRQRLYLEAMQQTLPAAERVLVIDDGVQGLLPLLDLSGRKGILDGTTVGQTVEGQR